MYVCEIDHEPLGRCVVVVDSVLSDLKTEMEEVVEISATRRPLQNSAFF